MDFGDAIRALKNGKRVARAGWNGKGMWLHLVPAHGPRIGDLDREPHRRAYIEMLDATDSFVPWLASQTDVLAEDWAEIGLPERD
jgi:hypothetical protein